MSDEEVRLLNVIKYATILGINVVRYDDKMFAVNHMHNTRVNIIYGLKALEDWLRGYQFAITVNETEGYEEGPYKWRESLNVSD